MVVTYKGFSEEELIQKFFIVLNAAQKEASKRVSESEIKMLMFFLTLSERNRWFAFSSKGKKEVIQRYLKEGIKMSNLNLNTKIYTLIDKGYIKRHEDRSLTIADFIVEGVKRLVEGVEKKGEFEIIFRFKKEEAVND